MKLFETERQDGRFTLKVDRQTLERILALLPLLIVALAHYV